MASCTRDEDCRKAEGYVCDPAWNACVLPGLAAPRAPVCEGTAPPRKTFGKVTQLSTPKGPGTYHFEPAAALTKTGDVAAVYIANSVPDFTKPGHLNPLGTAVLKASGETVLDRELKSSRENHFDPWLATDREGTIHAVWMGFDGGRAPERNMEIALATSKDGVEWSAPRAVHDVESDCPGSAPGCFDKPMIAIGPDKQNRKQDAIYVFYFSEPGGGMKMVRSTDKGQTFGKSVLVGEGAFGDAEVDASGNIHVVYTDADPRTGGFGDPAGSIMYVVSTDGGATFAKPIPVSAEGESIPFFFSNPQVVPDPKRKSIHVVYPAGTPDAGWDIMLATTTNGGKDWKRIKVNDDEHCANHMTPTAALDPRTGAVHVVWTENRASAGRVAYARCTAKGCSPNESVSEAAFAAYELVRHAPTWLGEYYSLLVDGKRRKLHVVWTQTVNEEGIPRSRIFHAEGALK